mgnify:CR=1 FL=1
MENEIVRQLVAGLFLWTLLCLGAAVVGLYAKGTETSRAFWFMTGMWALVDGVLAWSGLVSKPGPIDALARLLAINAGLDLLYVVVGIILATRRKPILRGFGLAVVLQGLFLLAFDLYFHARCSA